MMRSRTGYLRSLLLFVLLGYTAGAFAQQKPTISLQDIWASGKFSPKSVQGVNWMNDARYYTSQVPDEKNKTTDLVKMDVTSGKPVATLVEGESLVPAGGKEPIAYDGYEFTKDEQKILFTTETEPIYRRSTKANYYVYDVAGKKLTELSKGGKQQYATISPDGKTVAFARENNMFTVDLATMQEKQITTSGKKNEIINGSTDWVYEEEFEFAQGFSWNADGSKLAFYTFDERQVPEYNMQKWGSLYPEDYRYKYPKAGEANSIVTVSIYDIKSGNTLPVDVGPEKDQYIPRINWTKDPNVLSLRRMNRLQNQLDLLHADARTGKTRTVLTEKDKAYVDINDDLTYLKNGKQFIFSSEKDGYKHLYLHNMDGSQVNQITKGNWEVTNFLGVDEKAGTVYYVSTEVSPMERQLYRTDLKGKAKSKKRLTTRAGTHTINLSPDFKYYLDYFTSASTPTVVSLFTASEGEQVKVLEDNAKLNETLKGYAIAKQEFIRVPVDGGVQLNGFMIKPVDFDANKKYPVLMFVYGGPGSQTVTDSWGGANYLWYQVLAQKGYIIVSVDNRGTGARGAEFKKMTYAQMGKYETQDQISAAKWLAQQPYVASQRIGIWGWSYGGFMTSLALTLGADVFKAGIAVAPVTNWRFYDSVYTERFMKKPQDNASGYDDNSPVTHAAKLKGNNFLMVHGTGDDNVHFQNAVAMEDALIKANKQFESFYYPNRNHGIYGGNTRLHLYQMMTDFIERKL